MGKKQTSSNQEQQNIEQNEGQFPEQYLQEEEEQNDFDEHAQVKRNNQLLNIIGEFVVNSPKDNIRLTWQALYSLKRMEMNLNESMISEIQKIKDKYELMKQPIYTQISDLALAPRQSNPNKKSHGVGPQRIPDFWVIVFTKAGLLNDQITTDVDCFHHLQSFTCDLVEQDFNHYRINFTFRQQPKYFTNKQLELTIKMSNQQEQAALVIKKPIKYKLPRNQESLFTQLFDNSNIEQVASLVTEISQSYRNSLYFYFSPYHQANMDNDEEYPNQHSSKKLKSQISSANKTDELQGSDCIN